MPRAVQFDFQPGANSHPTDRWGNRLRSALRNNNRPGAPGAPPMARPRRYSRPAATFPGAGDFNLNYPDYAHCPCCRYNNDRPTFPTSTNPTFNAPLPQDPPQPPHRQQQPVEPLTTWQYPSGTLQWTPNTFTGANSSVPLPADGMPAPWTGAAAPNTLSGIQLDPLFTEGTTNWDISRRPSTAIQVLNGAAFTTVFSRPAVQPEFRKMTIDVGTETGIPHWAFAWGRLRVNAEGPGGITIKNVMDAIYNYFRMPLTHRDLEMIRPADQAGILRTQTARINSRRGQHRLVDPELLRVDLLLGRHYFMNLTVMSFRGSHCKVVLRFADNPGY